MSIIRGFNAQCSKGRDSNRCTEQAHHCGSPRTFLCYGLQYDFDMLLDGDDGERRSYCAQRILLRLKMLAVIICVVVLFSIFMPDSPRPVPMPPTFTDAGSVVSVQFHDNTFSRSTSVSTSEGTFQVAGAVTASTGDVAKIKKSVEIGSVEATSLCIDSHYKPDCYRVL